MAIADKGRTCCRWVEAAGGVVRLAGRSPQGVEVSPTVSYAGEGLQALCAGRVLGQAYDVFLQVPQPLSLHIHVVQCATCLISWI